MSRSGQCKQKKRKKKKRKEEKRKEEKRKEKKRREKKRREEKRKEKKRREKKRKEEKRREEKRREKKRKEKKRREKKRIQPATRRYTRFKPNLDFGAGQNIWTQTRGSNKGLEKNRHNVARMGEKRNAYRLFVGKPEGKRPLGRP
jgi:hypothetical protein